MAGKPTMQAVGSKPSEVPTPAALRHSLRSWLQAEGDEIRALRDDARTIATELAHTRWLFGRLWDAGFSRWGWSEQFGGLGGSSRLRAVVMEEIALGGYAHPTWFSMPEVMGPTFASMASPTLAETFLPRYLSGNEWWCQGFSEPDAGSDLASLRTRAEQRGSVFVVSGQKVWTTAAHLSAHCVLLVRTGAQDSGHRGITAMFVDLDTPGITVRPLRTAAGDTDFCELFLDEVVVPADRLIGGVGGGWAFALSVLACERSTVFWGCVAGLYERFDALLKAHTPNDRSAETLGSLYQLLHSFRARSAATQRAVADGEFDMAASSIDKMLRTACEQELYAAAADLFGDRLSFSDGSADSAWRTEFLNSRAASIYGGTSEIQRNIIAERLLGLPR